MTPLEFQAAFQAARTQVQRVIVGLDNVVDGVLTALRLPPRAPTFTFYGQGFRDHRGNVPLIQPLGTSTSMFRGVRLTGDGCRNTPR